MYNLDTKDIKLAGKIYLYLLNANTDAKLAEELISVLKHQDLNKVTNPRIKQLLKDVDLKNKRFIYGLAYCQYLMNGYYDYIYQFLLVRFMRTKNRDEILKEINMKVSEYAREINVTNAYIEFPEGETHFVSPMIYLLFRKLPFKEIFLKRFNLDEDLIDYKEYVKAMIHVQRMNISNNNIQAKAIENGQSDFSTKIKYIFEYSEEFSNPKVFRDACTNTLRAASGWDKWFIRILKLFTII